MIAPRQSFHYQVDASLYPSRDRGIVNSYRAIVTESARLDELIHRIIDMGAKPEEIQIKIVPEPLNDWVDVGGGAK